MHSGLLAALLLAALLLAARLLAAPRHPDAYLQWKLRFAISFESELEQFYRETIFMQNLQLIEAHNANPHRSYDMGVNQFTALTQQEFQYRYLLTPQASDSSTQRTETAVHDQESLATAEGDVDWQAKNAVTKIKNQGQCNACYAFAAAGALEGFQAIHSGILKDLSSQQIIDCSVKTYGNFGCTGGKVSNAFDFVKDKGVVTETEYPYKAVSQNCLDKAPGFKISQYLTVDKNCAALEQALRKGPVAVMVDASNWGAYKSGIFDNCPNPHPNFTLLLVGMTQDYWRLKNQWSNTWGESGFIRLKRGATCGVCESGTYPFS